MNKAQSPKMERQMHTQASEMEHRLEVLERELEDIKTTFKYRGRVLTALSLTVAALAVPIVIVIPIISTDWSYAVGDTGKVSFHIASRKIDFDWINNLFPPSSMGVLLIAAAFSLTGQGDKVGLLLARYMPFVTVPQSSSEASKAEEDKR